MDVAKFIRILGYIVYTILWSPVIVLIAVALPIWAIATCVKYDFPMSYAWKWLKEGFWYGVGHDMNFIKTGEW